MFLVMIIRTALSLLPLSAVVHSNRTLYIGGFFPIGKDREEGHIGRGVIPAVNLALKHINESPRYLHGYELRIHYNDTKCDTAVGMKNFFDMLSTKPAKVVLFGAACTPVTDPIAKASKFFHLSQLTYADTHPMYTSESYPNFFRIVPSESEFNPARVAFLQHFNWTRVGTVYQNSPRYSLPHTKLLTHLDMAKIEIAATQGFADELRQELQKLKENDVRIILGNFNEAWARKIFCEAYKLGMYGRRYQWLIVGMYRNSWWTIKDDSVTCTQHELLQALEGYIATDVLPLSSSDIPTISGMTSAEYEMKYSSLRKMEYSRFHGYAYDGIWAIALAIQAVLRKLRIMGTNLSLRDFRYRDPIWGQLFREAFNETSFIGVTGNVSFEKNERRGIITFKQFQGEKEVKVAEYYSAENYLDLSDGSAISWRGNSGPPVDRTLQIMARVRVSRAIYSSLTCFAVLGILLASTFLIINIKYRNQRYIKMSSPYLNNLIIIGCILTYTSVILLGLDSELTTETHFPYVCTARAWVLMAGFTLAFGSMFSKTWRVHAIFTNIKLNKKVIKDYKLFMVVGVLVIIDIGILITWQALDPFYRFTTTGAPSVSRPSLENDDVLIVPVLEFCQSKRMTIFLGAIYAYKGLLMAFGCFLAWETRHVNIPALNDSKYIGMSVYNVVIMCVIGAAVSYLLREHQDAAFLIISIFIIFCSTATLCLVFVPKVRLLVELWRNPRAGDSRVRATLKPLKKSRRRSEDETIHSRLRILMDDNHRQRQKLEERTIELQNLVAKLKEIDEPMIIITHGFQISSPILEDVVSSTCEETGISYGVSAETYSEEISKSSWASSETHLLEIKPTPEYQRRKISAHSVRFPIPETVEENGRVRAEKSCPELNQTGAEQATSTMPLRPRSLLEEFALIAKYADASSSSESPPTPRGPNDPAYARLISNGQTRNGSVNDKWKPDIEESDKFLGIPSQDSIRRHSVDSSRMATSVPQVSVIGRERQYYPRAPILRSQQRSSRHLSQPSIKCDIVEYL